MSDFKSKLPDLKELGEMTTKLYKDIRNSVTEIIGSYKQKHPKTEENTPETTVSESVDKQPDEKKKSTDTDNKA
jgi:hypothetical protein